MYKIEQRVKWIQDKVKEANADGVAIAISGGIDSAVCAALAKKAFPDNTFGVFLAINNTVDSKRNFLRVINALDIEEIVVNLEPAFELMMQKTFEYKKPYASLEVHEQHAKGEEIPRDKSYLDHPKLDLIRGNLKARLRMAAIYAHAQKNNYLVLETTNLSEAVLGYFTKWGDGAGDIAPISDLYKQEVYAMGKELGIPDKVLGTAPTADLWEGQTDEQEMGFTYKEFELWHKGEEIAQESKDKIESMVNRNKHKSEGIYQFKDDYGKE